MAYIFDLENTEVYLKSYVLPADDSAEDSSVQPLLPSGKRIRAIPEEWTLSFGKEFYLHELSLAALENQSEHDWKLRLKGRLFESGIKLNVTGFDELRSYIQHELQGLVIVPHEADLSACTE